MNRMENGVAIPMTDAEIAAWNAEKEAYARDVLPVEQMAAIRAERDKLLAATDYLGLSDVTMSADMQTYRQALRDLPANTSDPASPTWPVKPS